MCDEVETFPQRKRRCQGVRDGRQRKEPLEPKNLPISLSGDVTKHSENFQKKFEKPLDNLPLMCYNDYSERERKAQSPPKKI